MQGKSILSKQSIGDRIKQRRQLLNLTQRALAEKVGLSPGAIGRLESERTYITSRPTIIALSQALGCDPDWLASGAGKVHGNLKTPESVTKSDRKMKVFLDSLPSKVRAAISEHGLAGGHYLDMESLLETALKTRAPLKDQAEEEEFQWMLRKWGRRRQRGRNAITHGIKVLDELAQLLLIEHMVESAAKKTLPSGTDSSD